MTVVEPVKVEAPRVREEQFSAPQVRVFVPIFKSVLKAAAELLIVAQAVVPQSNL